MQHLSFWSISFCSLSFGLIHRRHNAQNEKQIYIIIAIAVLIVIAAIVFFKRKGKREKISTLAGIAFAFIIAGIVFSENEFFGYGLMGVGVVLAVVDIFLKRRK